MFSFLIGPALGVAEAELQARAARDAWRNSFCHMAAHWQQAADVDVIDVEAREVPEARLLGHDEAAK